MMNYRRLTAMLLVSGLLTGAVAGCGSSTQTTDSGSGTTAQTAAQDDTFEILQTKDDGTIMGDYYVGSNEDTINWGRLPNRDTEPVLTVESGSTVTFDTVSHEGLLEDQGRDALEYFTSQGVSEDEILTDAINITDSDIAHDFLEDGPHIVTGPVEVEGAEPGDVLKVEVLDLQPRVPYGVISNRHYKGALPDEFPENSPRYDDASAEEPEKYGDVSKFAPIKKVDDVWCSYYEVDGKEVTYELDSFLGIMGVATDTEEMLSSVPPTEQGGNLDINELGEGSTLYLPIEVEGAMFYTGDPHFAQGDGEVALTALEGSLRGTVRLTVLKNGSEEIVGDSENFTQPFGETEDYWIPIGLDEDLDEAMKEACRESIDFLNEQLGVDRDMAYAYLSAATDYEVSQVVDKTKGIHALIKKTDFINLLDINLTAGDTKQDVAVIDRTFYTPLEDTVKALGGSVKWNGDTATVTLGSVEATMTKNSNIYYSNSAKVVQDSALVEQDGTVLIPVQALNEVLNASVNWSTSDKSLNGIVIAK